MEELSKISSYRKELEEIATIINDEAIYNIKYGFKSTKSPYITGNLYNQVRDYNSVRTMLKEISDEKVEIVFNAAPPKANYGIYVTLGTSTSKNYGPRDYSALGMYSQEVRSKIKAIQDEIFEDTNVKIQTELSRIFSQLPKKV